MAVRNVSVLVLYNDHKEILLQHRSKDAERLQNYWAFFGGGIEGAESPEQAVTRELLEELEYNVVSPTLIFNQKFVYEGDENTKYVFVEKFDPSKQLTLREGQGIGWWKFEDLKDLLIIDHDRIVLSKIREFLNA